MEYIRQLALYCSPNSFNWLHIMNKSRVTFAMFCTSPLKKMICLEELPNEIIYRIFDHLDCYAIVLLSWTCRRLYDSRENYQHYRLDFQSIVKRKFDRICRLINPSHVIELILSDDANTPGQIPSFLANYPWNRLIRLKSLNLIQINENDLEKLLHSFLNSSLTSLRIEYRQYFTLLNQSTLSILSKILSLQTLKKVNLDMRTYQTDYIPWPSSTNIEELILGHLNLKQFVRILENSTNRYRSISVRNLNMNDCNASVSSKCICLKELKGFQLEESELFLSNIQWLMSLMTELIYFKLDGYTTLLVDIFRLEDFIPMKLKKFEVFIRFSPWQRFLKDTFDFPLLIEHFQKSLWTSKLNCLVNCDLIGTKNELHFYSIPCSNSSFEYADHFNLISFSTSLKSNYIKERLNFVRQLELNLQDLQNKGDRLFPKLTSLKLTINDQCSADCFDILVQSIHLEHLVKLVLTVASRGDYLNLMLKMFFDFLKNCSNVRSLQIFNRWHGIFSHININTFCSMMPRNLEHLDIDILDFDHIRVLLSRLDHISSFKFRFSFDKSPFVKDILQWLSNQHINYTHISDIHYLSIWISKEPNNQTNSRKRLKLTV